MQNDQNIRLYSQLVGSKVLRAGIVSVFMIASFVFIHKLHDSAQRLIEGATPDIAYNNELSAAPLATLSDVTISARQSGHDLARINAAALTIGRISKTIDIRNASGVLPVGGSSGTKLTFTCGLAEYIPGFMGPRNAAITLSSGINAGIRSPLGIVKVSAAGLTWNGATSIATAIGAVNSTIGNLGEVVCNSMTINLAKRMIDFGPVDIAVSSAVLLSNTGSNGTAPPTTASPEDVHAHFPEGGHWEQNNHTFTTSGAVVLVQGDVKLVTVGVDYNSVTDIAHAHSAVTINDGANTLRGDGGDVNFKTHIANIQGHVDIAAIPKSSPNKSNDIETEANKPTHVHCDTITYNYRTKIADASGHLTVLQNDRTVTATTGHYDTTAQTILLSGNVDGKSNDGRHLTAPDATVSVNPDDEWIEIKGPVTYDFPVSDVDNPLPVAAQKKTQKAPKSSSPSASTPYPQPAPIPSPSPSQ